MYLVTFHHGVPQSNSLIKWHYVSQYLDPKHFVLKGNCHICCWFCSPSRSHDPGGDVIAAPHSRNRPPEQYQLHIDRSVSALLTLTAGTWSLFSWSLPSLFGWFCMTIEPTRAAPGLDALSLQISGPSDRWKRVYRAGTKLTLFPSGCFCGVQPRLDDIILTLWGSEEGNWCLQAPDKVPNLRVGTP